MRALLRIGTLALALALVAGAGRFCTGVMSDFSGRVFVKTGAEGVYCGAIPEAGLGIAVKCDDGATRAAETLMAAVIAAFESEVKNRLIVLVACLRLIGRGAEIQRRSRSILRSGRGGGRDECGCSQGQARSAIVFHVSRVPVGPHSQAAGVFSLLVSR